jgi:hypothetical protein
MAFALADRVKETTTTTGTGTVNLSGAVTGFQTFVSGIGTTNICYYVIAGQGTSQWEVGTGTVTSGSPDTLSRTTVLSSSNAGALVSFSAGTKDVFCTLPASKALSSSLRYELSTTSANDSVTSFAFSQPVVTTFLVFVGGVAQNPADISVVSGNIVLGSGIFPPATGIKVAAIYNTDIVGGIGGGAAPIQVTDNFVATGSTPTFTASATPVVGSTIYAAYNGAIQAIANWSVSGSDLTFGFTPPTDSQIVWAYCTSFPSSNVQTQEDFTGDDTTTDFVLSHTPVTNGLAFVAYNGAVQATANWSLITPGTIRFGTAPIAGAGISVGYRY